MDTEGFGGVGESCNHDSRIFLFSLLLSSYFIYNSVGAIDENAMGSLGLIINLAKEIITSEENNKSIGLKNSDLNPSFLWIVRDFVLKLQDIEGNSINSKEYLEKSLEIQKGFSEQIENRNRVRKLLKHFFRERDCFTLVRPCEAENKLQKLHQLDNSELRQEFIDESNIIRNKIFSKIRPKTLGGNFINANLLLSLSQHFVDTINEGKIPVVQTSWNYLSRAENYKAFKSFIIIILVYKKNF